MKDRLGTELVNGDYILFVRSRHGYSADLAIAKVLGNTTNFMKVVMFEYSGHGENYKTPHRQLVSNYKCVKIDTTLVPTETLNGLDKEY